jgi:hypothetical protein
MSIILEHIPFYRDIFKTPGLMQDNLLLIGLPDIEGSYKTSDFNYKNLVEYLKHNGPKNISTLKK